MNDFAAWSSADTSRDCPTTRPPPPSASRRERCDATGSRLAPGSMRSSSSDDETHRVARMSVRMTDSVDGWKEVERVLDFALDLPAEERAAFLDHACTGDAELRDAVDTMLEACAGSEGFLEAEAAPL